MDSDVVEARFVSLEPGVSVVQEIDFESDDPAFAGTMTMTWDLRSVVEGPSSRSQRTMCRTGSRQMITPLGWPHRWRTSRSISRGRPGWD